MRLDARIDELLRRQVAFEDRILQLFSRREQALGEYRPVRLARTVADPTATPTYPADDSRANVFPIVFLDAGFVHAAGVQNTSFTDRWDKPQAFVCTLGGQFLPEGSIIQVWQDRGTDSAYPGEWWTIHRPCLPTYLSRGSRISGDQWIEDRWYSYAPCDAYVPYVVADFTDCYVPYSPYAPGGTLNYFTDNTQYADWSGINSGGTPNTPWVGCSLSGDIGVCYSPNHPEFTGAAGEYAIELPVTIGAGGGFVQFSYNIDSDLAAAGYGPLECKVDGVTVWSASGPSAVGEIPAGPFELTAGAHTISFSVDSTSATTADVLARIDDVTIWGV